MRVRVEIGGVEGGGGGGGLAGLRGEVGPVEASFFE